MLLSNWLELKKKQAKDISLVEYAGKDIKIADKNGTKFTSFLQAMKPTQPIQLLLLPQR